MKCDKAQEFLSDYIENTLDRPMTVALESHLNSCEACSTDVASLRSMWAVLDKVPQVEPPADFVWNTTNRIRNEMLNRREAERAPALPWWKRLTPAQTFSYAGIAALLIIGLAFPVQNVVQTWGPGNWPGRRPLPVPAQSVPPVTPPRFDLQVSPQGGAVVTIVPTSEMPNTRVTLAYLTPFQGSLQGKAYGLIPMQMLSAGQAVPITVAAGGARAATIAVTSRVGSADYSFQKTVILPGAAQPSGTLQNVEPYFALHEIAALTGQAMLVDSGLTNPVTVELQSLTPQQALGEVLRQTGARAETLPNGVLSISRAR